MDRQVSAFLACYYISIDGNTLIRSKGKSRTILYVVLDCDSIVALDLICIVLAAITVTIVPNIIANA